jgi:phosphoribosylformylglycinamidine cyclo-ligase
MAYILIDDLTAKFNQEQTFLDAFLKPTRLYVKPVLAVKSSIKIYAMTHIMIEWFT